MFWLAIPVVNLKATLYDGSYHPVDSSEMAFKTAAQLAYKAGLPDANPTILEPIGELKVTIPDSMGDIIGDLNKRAGRVMGMNPDGKGQSGGGGRGPHGRDDDLCHRSALSPRAAAPSPSTSVRYEEAPLWPSRRPLRRLRPSRSWTADP